MFKYSKHKGFVSIIKTFAAGLALQIARSGSELPLFTMNHLPGVPLMAFHSPLAKVRMLAEIAPGQNLQIFFETPDGRKVKVYDKMLNEDITQLQAWRDVPWCNELSTVNGSLYFYILSLKPTSSGS